MTTHIALEKCCNRKILEGELSAEDPYMYSSLGLGTRATIPVNKFSICYLFSLLSFFSPIYFISQRSEASQQWAKISHGTVNL